MDFMETLNVIYDFLLFIGMTIIYICETMILSIVPRRYRYKSVRGEITLVTGGAAGIGKIIAQKLSMLGARVIIWDIDKEKLEDTVNEIKRAGGKCWGYCCDVGDREKVYKTAKAVKVEVGNVSLLINNAGYVYGKTLLEIPDDEIERTFKINILAHYWTAKAFLRNMMKENHGHIVTVSSVAGMLGVYKCTDYSAAKSAAIAYHESLFTELRMHGYNGIHVSLVCPYFINTGMFNGAQPRIKKMLEPEYVANEVISGILVNQVNITLPNSVRLLLPFKCLLPAKSCWTLMYRVMRGPQSMITFKGGRKCNKCNENNNIINSKIIHAE